MPHLTVQRSQCVELLIVDLGSAAHARFGDLLQPPVMMPW